MEQYKSRLTYTFYMLTFFLCGAICFLFGFFPASYSMAEDVSSVPIDRPTTLHGLRIEPPPMSYNSFILFLIDALREDFPNSKSMPVAYSKACKKLTLHVDIPTVTMPRLKSITTGTLSNFIDIVLNLGKIEQLDDSLLHRLKKRNAVVSFAGDNTWLKLFPSEFKRSLANNDSFFVNEFYKGDQSVTNVLELELNKKDWTLLILHYLGLDHIGHVEGNESPKVPDKLYEMDMALQKILEHKNMPNYLVMLTGDHGMANGGGHGGNTQEEVTVPLYLYSMNCSKTANTTKRYNQIDLAPTLAILLSIEIPKMSIGCLIPEMLESLSVENQMYAYFYNAHHLLNRARVRFGHKSVRGSDYYHWYQNATLLHKKVLDSLHDGNSVSLVHLQNAKLNYMRTAREISLLLSESLIKFDYGFIAVGLALVVSTSLHIAISVLFLDRTGRLQLDKLNTKQMLVSFGFATIFNIVAHYLVILVTSSLLQSVLMMLLMGIAIYLSFDVMRAIVHLALPLKYSRSLKMSIPLPLPLLACFAIRIFTLGSSSFIEREYKTWYYLGNSLLLVTAFRTLRQRITKANVELGGRHLYKIASTCLWQQRKIFVVSILLTLMRYLYRLNDIKTMLMIFSLLLFWARLRKFNSSKQNIFTGLSLLFVYIFRGLSGHVSFFFDAKEHNLVYLIVPTLVLFWCCVAAVGLMGYLAAFPQGSNSFVYERSTNILLQLLQTNLTCSLLVAALLHKVHNVVLLPTLLITLDETYKLCDAYCASARRFSVRLVHVYKIILTIFVARMFHFYQGNSNSLSTIDLTPGYIGQTKYNPIVVGCFITLNTYCAEINCFLYLIVHTLRADLTSVGIIQLQPPYARALDALVVPLYAALIMLPAAFYLCLMVGFRYHLFIYSVFSPKVLYDCYTVLVFYLVFLVTSLYFKLFKRDA